MAEPFLSEIRLFSFGFAPNGWALCNGQLLPINQNQALFALLGTTYGGNGITTFALPDLRGRIPVHNGSGFTLGQTGGAFAHTLSISELPQHGHVPRSGGTATALSPAGAVWANPGKPAYGSQLSAAMNSASMNMTGGSQAHENTAPYAVVSFAIALQGIFPSQN